METLLEMHRRGDMQGIWKRYCGWVDLSMEEYTAIQEQLLTEQLVTWQKSSLVKRIFGGSIPSTVKEFRDRAPLTTYEEYAEDLLRKNEEALPEATYEWIHTSGRSGQYEYKWIPFTKRMYDVLSDDSLSIFMLGSARRRGEILLKEGDRIMFSLAPLPFVSGLAMRALHEQFNFRILPPYEEALKMDYFQRMKEAIKLAYSEGLDYFWGITSLVINISEQLEHIGKAGKNVETRRMLRQRKVFFRMLRGRIKAILRGGPIRPRDIWNIKGIICGGMDTSLYRERIRAMWGEYPREGYGCTEFGYVAQQHFAAPGQVMRVKSSFFEFMELGDYRTWKENRSFKPRLRLLSEVEAGREYALVGTNFHGGVLVRYVLGDSVTILSLSDEKNGLKLPQLVITSRIDDVIDIANFTRLTEKIVWAAVEGAEMPYVDWVISKESKGESPMLHLYVEPKGDPPDVERAQALIHEKLKLIDQNYKNLEEMAGIKPLVVTLLSPGTFARYLQERQAAGFDLAHSKPVHMSPKADVLARLLAMSALKI